MIKYLTHSTKRCAYIAIIFISIETQAQNQFLLPRDTAFGFSGHLSRIRLAAGDLDNDGDLDLLSCDYWYGRTYFHLNTGTLTNPNFASAPIHNPFNYSGIGKNIDLADLNNDELLDILLLYHTIPARVVGYIPNQGTRYNPNFSGTPIRLFHAAGVVGMTSGMTYDWVKLTAVDLDNDGDKDVIVGTDIYVSNGSIVDYFENTGSAAAPSFNINTLQPFYFPIIDYYVATCSFADMDNDQDLDAWCTDIDTQTNQTSVLRYIENVGSDTNAVFAAGTNFAMGISDTLSNGLAAVAYGAAPLATDIDSDGDIDILVTGYRTNVNSKLVFYENTRCQPRLTTIDTIGNIIQISNTSDSILWFRNNVLLQNETGYTLDIRLYGAGSYRVQTIDTAGCITNALAKDFWAVSVDKTIEDKNQLRCMPNPVANQLFIESSLSFERFDIINAQGQIVRNIEQPTSQQINTSDLAQGIYTLRGYTAKGTTHATRFVKQ